MVKNNKLFVNNPFLDIFKGVFVGMFGIISVNMMIALYSLTFASTGYFLLKRYNKPNTELLDELQTGQYIGIIFCIIGLLPYMQYFFAGFLMEGGQYAFNKLLE